MTDRAAVFLDVLIFLTFECWVRQMNVPERILNNILVFQRNYIIGLHRKYYMCSRLVLSFNDDKWK